MTGTTVLMTRAVGYPWRSTSLFAAKKICFGYCVSYTGLSRREPPTYLVVGELGGEDASSSDGGNLLVNAAP